MTPVETLRDLEDQAWALEAQHKYDSVDRRTARHEVDPARDNPIAPPRLVLLVIAAYPKWMEHQAFYGHKGPGERYGIEAHIAYAVELEGIRLPLRSRAQALEVLETRQLPRSVLPPPPRPEYDADECDALLDEIAAKSKGGAS